MTMSMKNELILTRAYPVLPVIVIEELSQAVPLAKALSAGGIHVFEVTLRTVCALEAIQEIKAAMPDCITGAGTVTSPDQIEAVLKAGADFAVSPGATPALLKEAFQQKLALIPGVSTPSDVIQAMEHGYNLLKLFPAEQSGGINMLKALAGPFPDIRFCPTGGIGLHNAKEYLALNNVAAIGGSWICPANLVQSKDWGAITQLATQAISSLKKT
nr:bifunctional 4-hydroxy-2-oxoglutarate aldolase/2-dehydro-3-deoxy-phosphogluconate aldolase [Endozoicomonas sp.]